MKFLMTDGKSSFPGGSNDTNIALYAFPEPRNHYLKANNNPRGFWFLASENSW
jgi:hypothetical protein